MPAAARLILVRVKAPDSVVRRRLEGRARGADALDRSEAGWEVYTRMKAGAEPIRRRHIVVDTSKDIGPVVERVLKEVTSTP